MCALPCRLGVQTLRRIGTPGCVRVSSTCRLSPTLTCPPAAYRHRTIYCLIDASRSLSSNSPILSTRQSSTDANTRGLYKLKTIPNALCALRIVLTPVIGYSVVQDGYSVALALFVFAGATDLADGWIARHVPGQASLLGSVLDPVADKLLLSTLFVTLTIADQLPVWLTALVILRDVCLISGGFYKRYRTMDPPFSISRFFDPRVSSMQITPTLTSKVNTVLQLTVVAMALSQPVFDLGAVWGHVLQLLTVSTAVTTVWSGMQYMQGSGIRQLRSS